MTGLSPKQQHFARVYVGNGFNATAAAEAAGYAHPNVQGPRLLVNVGVKSFIDELVKPEWKRQEINKEWILNEIALVAGARLGDILFVTEDGDPYLDFTKMDERHKAALEAAEIEDMLDGRERDPEGKTITRDVRKVKGKFASKLKALELLGRAQGLFKDVIQHEAGDGFAEAMRAADERVKKGRDE